MLSDSDIEALEDILFAEPWGDDALDFFGLHGVVCASVVGPVEIGRAACRERVWRSVVRGRHEA